MLKKFMALFCAAMLLAMPVMGEMPEPEFYETNMIIGESSDRFGQEITLYYSTADGTSITPVRRTVMISAGESIVQRALSELMISPNSSDLLPVVPGDTRITDVEECGGFVTVNLALDASSPQNGEDLLRINSAVCNTLTALEGVENVNVLINSRQESVCGLPMGVMGESDNSITVNMARYQAESERLDGVEGQLVSRVAALYFPSVNGQLMLPELREITFSGADYAGALLDALVDGSLVGGISASYLTVAVDELPEAGEVYVNSRGLRVLDISISDALRDYLILQGVADWQMAASLTLTMCSFIPELDGIRVNINGEVMREINIKGSVRQLDDGLITRDMFEMYVGGIGKLYFPTEDGKLTEVRRAMSSRRAASAYSLLLQLISGPSAADTGAVACMPEGIAADDVLGVAIEYGVATVNMSYDFYRLCQNIDESEERLLVYSVVNTLCTLRNVEAVSILIEGEKVDTLANSIYLKTELMPNPGFISE